MRKMALKRALKFVMKVYDEVINGADLLVFIDNDE